MTTLEAFCAGQLERIKHLRQPYVQTFTATTDKQRAERERQRVPAHRKQYSLRVTTRQDRPHTRTGAR